MTASRNMDLTTIAHAIGRQLRRHRSALSQEELLQETIARALQDCEFVFDREVRLSPGERLDFFIADAGVAIEVKKHPATLDVWRQVQRYLAHAKVEACIVIAPRIDPLGATILSGKPIYALELWKYLL